jgi:TrmH family RNA methyltransferase
MITSVSNGKVKLVRSLARRRARYAARQFVVEGVRSIEEAQGAGITPALVFYTATADAEPRVRALLERCRARTPEVFEVDDAIMQAVSNTETPSGVLAVLPFVELSLPAHPQLALVLDAVRDPGNAGAILRSAWAAGVDVIYFARGTADPYNDKVVRAAMGAHFHVPLRVAHNWDEIGLALKGIPRIYLADAQGPVTYTQADWSPPVALVVGGEAEGAGEEARRLATARVSIPMRRGAESLNAAMAAAVLLFQAART